MEAFLIGPDLTPRGRLPWLSASATPALNAAGAWTMQVPGESRMASRITPGCRVYVADYGGFSGLITTIERSMTSTGTLNINLSGVLDINLLGYRITYPSPLKALGAQDTDYYKDSGTGGAVLGSLILRNAGAAALSGRPIPGLVWDIPDSGSKVSVSTRLESLLDVAGTLADQAGLVLDVAYKADRKIHATAHAPVDRSRSMVLRQQVGTLGEWQTSTTAPEATAFILGGQGEGKARQLKEYDLATADTWGVRVEQFKDQRDAADTTALDKAGNDLVAATAGSAAVTLTISETRRRYGRDFRLGDIVSANLGGVVFTDKIQAAEITWGEDDRTVKLTVGKDPDRENTTPLWVRRVRALQEAQRKLEAI